MARFTDRVRGVQELGVVRVQVWVLGFKSSFKGVSLVVGLQVWLLGCKFGWVEMWKQGMQNMQQQD